MLSAPAAPVVWRYLYRGEVCHALLLRGSRYGRTAACGWSARYREDWLGDGTQRQRERLAELRECVRCVRRLESEG